MVEVLNVHVAQRGRESSVYVLKVPSMMVLDGW